MFFFSFRPVSGPKPLIVPSTFRKWRLQDSFWKTATSLFALNKDPWWLLLYGAVSQGMEEHGARAMDEASQTGVQTQSGTAEMTWFCMKTCELRKFWIDHYIAKTDFFYHLANFFTYLLLRFDVMPLSCLHFLFDYHLFVKCQRCCFV